MMVWIWSMLSRLKNLSTLIFLSSILPSIGKVNTPMKVIMPIEMKLIRLMKRLLFFDVYTVFCSINSFWSAVRLLICDIPL